MAFNAQDPQTLAVTPSFILAAKDLDSVGSCVTGSQSALPRLTAVTSAIGTSAIALDASSDRFHTHEAHHHLLIPLPLLIRSGRGKTCASSSLLPNMDFSSSLRRKQTSVTYSRRNRQQGTGSATSSPAAARPRPAADAPDGSSDEADGPCENGTPSKKAPVSPAKSSRMHPSSSSSASLSSSSRHAPNPPNGSAASPSKSTPGGLGPKSRTTPSVAAPHSTSSLPQRPARAASPSTAVKARRPSASSTLPAKRSASTSPRKSAASPSKRLARSRTPTRPAKDLTSLFDAIEPTLPQPRSNPFARSESQPVVHLAPFEALDPASPIDSPLQSPTLPHFGFDDQLSPGTAPISPSKRSRMADRMAPRTARPAKSKLDDIVESLSNSRRGSLRRTETAPSAIFDASLSDRAASDTGMQADNLMAPSRPSEPASSSARLDIESPAESQSQDTPTSASGARRLAGIKQTSATNAKRTYGLQRSFLADQAEENLLTDSTQPPTPNPIADTASRSIEDEIEAQINGHVSKHSTKPARVTSSAASRLSEANAPAHRESYAELLKKWGEGADDIEWDESQDPTLNLKSITSLRSTGELRRFNDDLEYLFSGLDPAQNLPIRKSSAVELIRLLCGKPDIGSLPDADDDSDADEESIEDPLASAQSAEFLRKLKASDLIVRLFDLFTGAEAGEGTDDVLDASLAVYVAKLLKTASYAEPLMRERGAQLHSTLANMLLRANRASRSNRKDGFALLRLHELKQHKIASRSDRKALDELRAISRISKLFVAGGSSWTARNLVLAACCSLIALPRRLWTEDTLSGLFADKEGVEDAVPLSLFHTVLEALISEGNKAQQRLVDFAKGLELVASTAVEAVPDLETVDVCIRFLDKAMDMLYLELDRNLPASDETLDALQHLIVFAIEAAPLDTLSNTGKAVERGAGSVYVRSIETRALQVLHVLFKMLLDLSQVDANWSESLASSAVLQTSIVRAFLLGHYSASRLRGTEGDSDDNNTRSPDVALFDDVVHLSLALLTNLLIKQLDKARDALEAVRLVPTCWRRRSCAAADACSCEGRLPALQLLARVFFETRIAAASRDDSNAAYLSNSIATAIAQFGVGGAERLEACRSALAAELPGAHSAPSGAAVIGEDGLQTLLDAVDEFAVVHEAALDAGRVRGDEEAACSKHGEDGAGGEEVAKETGQDGANPVAAEAGQLIKELAQTLRQMC